MRARPSPPRPTAFPGWSRLPAAQRAAFFFKAADALEARTEQMAQDMTAEMGKPLREARGEAARTAAILRFSGGEAYRSVGEVYEPSVPNQRLYTVRRPIGVVGLIAPWNFPAAIPVWKLAPALIYGNTVVLKLGYEAPRTGLHIAECFAEAGLPAGVLNVLTGAGSKVGAELVLQRGRARDLVHGLGGGRPLGSRGGDGPQLPRPARARRAQPDDRARATRSSTAPSRRPTRGRSGRPGRSAPPRGGSTCRTTSTTTSATQLLARIESGKVGDPSDPETEVGPLVNEGALEDVLAAVERGRAEGGTVLTGGERADDEAYLVAPTVFEGVADEAYLSCEEVFGPVTSLYRFSTLDEALARANAVEFGLSAAIFTRDLHAVQRFTSELQAGILHVNSQTAGADVHVPFGGIKGSGWGPHEQGRAALEFYSELVTVYQDAPLG